MKSLVKYIQESYSNKPDYVATLTARKRDSGIYASDSLYEEALEKFGEGAEVGAFAYTNYGGSLMDRAVIELYKESYPDKCVWEETSYDGQNMICELVDGFETDDFFYAVEGLEDKYYELEWGMQQEAAKEFCADHDCPEKFDEVVDWLGSYGSPGPNYIDYLESDLVEYLELEEA